MLVPEKDKSMNKAANLSVVSSSKAYSSLKDWGYVPIVWKYDENDIKEIAISRLKIQVLEKKKGQSLSPFPKSSHY